MIDFLECHNAFDVSLTHKGYLCTQCNFDELRKKIYTVHYSANERGNVDGRGDGCSDICSGRSRSHCFC